VYPSPLVLLDATSIPANLGGVGRYIEQLVPELDRDGVALVIACHPRDADWLESAAPNARVVRVRAASSRLLRLVWEQLGLPGLVRRTGAAVVHSPHYTFPLAVRRPTVVTLHDATFFTHPKLHSRVKRAFFRWWIRRALRRATACIVPSAATRDELEKHVNRRARECRVIHHGVDTATFRPPSQEEVAAVRAQIGDRWIAFLGTIEPRKNVPALVRGFRAARAAHPDVFGDMRLALLGAPGWETGLDVLLQSGGDDVVRLGYVGKDELRAWLGGATVVAYPSLGEGFGLPVAEAMACGGVVLTTRLLALPEVGGDAVAYCTPEPESIGRELTALVGDPDRRARLATAARERAQKFTWAAAAAGHRDAYRAAAAG
jgi:glycosyltransferase involved in cell wall biosynthesis